MAKKKRHKFLTTTEEDEIISAIQEAERQTSGEIRVHIEAECKGSIEERAHRLFYQLGMYKTQRRNGVLFYLAANNRRFYILGDEGIYRVVPRDFWGDMQQQMTSFFRSGKFKEGLVEGILEIGIQLKKYFPYEKGDQNELPDEISYQ